MDAAAQEAERAAGAVERRREAAAAGHAGDAAKARSYLHDDDPMVRASALRALERAGDLAALDSSRPLWRTLRPRSCV